MNSSNPPKMTSNKPYLLRALHAWIVDNHMTPYISVDTSKKNVRVPPQYIKDDNIILNISPVATLQLEIDNRFISFKARFSGVLTELWVPVYAVMGIYARESGMGMFFDLAAEEIEDSDDGDDTPTPTKNSSGKPHLTIVKS